jgi:hypothetical protein
MMTEVVSDLGALRMAMPVQMSTGRHLSITGVSFAKSLSKERVKGR